MFQNNEFHFFPYLSRMCIKMCSSDEILSGDVRIFDPLGYYSCHTFCRNIADRCGNINFLPKMTILSNGLINYL